MIAAPFDYSYKNLDNQVDRLMNEITSLKSVMTASIGDLKAEFYGRMQTHCLELQALNDLWQQYDILERDFIKVYGIAVGESK